MSRSRRSRKPEQNTTVVPDHSDEPSNCIICLETVSCRGKLSVCNHWFCFPCILEWAENTNTCPICKARFRCITKVHLSPFKSPPTKIRVGDKDQRVWNDDDDLVAEDVLYALDLDENYLDDDYVPPNYIDNLWTRSVRNRAHQRGPSERRSPWTSRQLRLDQYDLEDSFIDDSDDVLQEFLYSTYSRSRETTRNNDDNVDISVSDHQDQMSSPSSSDDNDESDDDCEENEECDGDSNREEIVVQRDKCYTLCNRQTSLSHSSRTTTNVLDSRETTRNEDNIVDIVVAADDGDSDDDGNEEEDCDTDRSSDEKFVAQKNKRYLLRNRHTSLTNSSRTTTNSLDRLQLSEGQSCASPASTDSFTVSNDDSDDDLGSDWLPFSNSRDRHRSRKLRDDSTSDWLPFSDHSKNSRERGRNRKQAKSRKQRSNSKQSAGPLSTRQPKQSQRNKQVSDQNQNNSKRKRQQTSITDDEFQELMSLGDREVETLSVNGWINTAKKQARAHTSTSSSYQRTRGKAPVNKRTRNTRPKQGNPVESRESSSDSDMEILRDKTKITEQPCHRGNNQVNKVNLREKEKQHISCPSTSSFIALNEVAPDNSSDDERNLSDAMIVEPSPCSKTTRSIFTKRRHRSPIATFDQLEDTNKHHLCRSQTQNKKRGSPKCTNKTLNNQEKKETETTLKFRSDLHPEFSTFVITEKQKRKRIKSLSSDSS